ncbi:transcriptional regulator SUPERMAN-like [Cornus florida]|uniref:transcriptional regulator SUPERMAN-like n=1 Tax=Cornus florida TaxID=4283 RepID=UPI00289BF9C0|nr:transcriptional regulator SUPERMAN-like [Cornus florida]
MESSAGNREESMNWSDQEVDDEQENEFKDGEIGSSAAGKSYDCIFCRRGFTNAQALGGHMNIHRKDRAKNNNIVTPSSCSIFNSTKIEEDNYYANPIFYQLPISSYPLHYYSSAPNNNAQQISYQTCFPSSSVSGTKPFSHTHHHHAINDQNPHSLNSLGELNWQTGLSLQFDSWHPEDHDEKRNRGAIQEDGLDLELRLGQDP